MKPRDLDEVADPVFEALTDLLGATPKIELAWPDKTVVAYRAGDYIVEVRYSPVRREHEELRKRGLL